MNNKVKFLRGTSGEYTVAEKDNDTIYFTTDDGKLYIGDKEVSGSDITIDDALSDTSTNPVQGNVIKQAIDKKADKSKYGDTTINVGRKAGTTVGKYSTAEGEYTTASSICSHAEGYYATASGEYSHAEGFNTTASGNYSHAEGCGTTAIGNQSHAEGRGTAASGEFSHAEGEYTTAIGNQSHVEGKYTIASGKESHAEGERTTASGEYSHAEGYSDMNVTSVITDFSSSTSNNDIITAWKTSKFSLAKGQYSHVEGKNCLALGNGSHAEGYCTTASGRYSHAGGYHTEALKESEFAHGKYNQSNDDTLFSIGDGTADDARHNAFEITTTGGKLHDKDIATTDLIPTTLPANGGNADTVNGHTVNSDVPANALFTDTINSDITASGNPVQLDGLQGGVPFNRVSVSGDDVIGREMTVGVCGRNLLTYPYNETSKTQNGITFASQSDGGIAITGQLDSGKSAGFTLKRNFRINGAVCMSGGSENIRLQLNTVDNRNFWDIGNGRVVSDVDVNYLRIFVSSEETEPIDTVIYPQMELGDTATPYEPYHGAEYTITPDSNPYTVPLNIMQYDGINVLSISDDSNPTISVSGTRENLAIKRIWDNISMDLLFDGITDESNPAMFDLTGYNVIEIHHIIVSTEKVCPIVIRMSIDNYLATPSTIINSICESSVSTVHNENGNISSLYAVLADGSAMTNTKIYGIK